MATYSFLSTYCTLTGPGGEINLGAGSGSTDEGITFEPNDDINKMDIAADGLVMHSLGANKSRTATVRIQKTSAVNQLLSAMYAFQTANAKNHGVNTISLHNPSTGDAITCQQVAFKRGVPLTYGKEGGMNEWTFDVGIFDDTLGGNV